MGKKIINSFIVKDLLTDTKKDGGKLFNSIGADKSLPT